MFKWFALAKEVQRLKKENEDLKMKLHLMRLAYMNELKKRKCR